MNDLEPAALLRFAHRLLDETDEILIGYFASEIAVSEKADGTLVTAADTEVEERLRSRLADAFPAHGAVGEEYGTERGQGEARWIIDPIDATYNFVRGITVFATLVALERSGELILGAVSAPAMRQRWAAAHGNGATARLGTTERPIRVSSVARVEEAHLCFGTLRTLDEEGLLPAWRRTAGRSLRDRGFGDFWGHMLVAQGSAEVMLDLGVSLWDLAAPAAIVGEAGGRMTDLAGRASWAGPAALTSNGLLHDELLAALASNAA